MKKFIDLGFYYSMVFIAITFPFPYQISNLGIVGLVVFWLLKQLTQKSKFIFFNKTDRLIFFCFIGLFIWNALSLFYTQDLQNGLKTLESKLSLLIFPVIFYSTVISSFAVNRIIKYYIYSLALCTIFLLGISINNYIQQGSLLTYHDFTGALDFHAVFYSYYIFLAILSAVFLLSKGELKTSDRILIYSSIVLSFIGLLISASKNVLVVTSVFLVLSLAFRIIKNKIGFKEVIGAILFFSIAFISISQVPVVKSRIVELTELNGLGNLEKIKNGEKLVAEDIPQFNGTTLRITFWYVSFKKLIEKNRLLIGLSPGDRRQIMNKEYEKNGINPWYENYNIHNQFMQTFVELGLIGLLIYLFLHLNILIYALNQKNLLLVAFIFGLIFFQMTESIIERNKGIVFFCFFLLLLKQISTKDENRNLRY